MKKTLFFITVITFIVGCCPKAPVFKYIISNDILAFVPYKEKDTVMFIYNNTKQINYVVNVNRSFDSENCHGCCKVINEFEVINFNLSTDYPISDIRLTISAVGKGLNISGFNSSFGIDPQYSKKMDSVIINNKSYYDVFVCYNSFLINEYEYIDSLFYNYSKGILKIFMSNNKNFEIYE